MNDQDIRETLLGLKDLRTDIEGDSWLAGEQRKDIDNAVSVLETFLAIKGSGVLPEIIDTKDGNADVWESGYETGKWEGQYEYKDETAIKLAKFLSGLQKKIGKLLYYRICEDGVSVNLPPDMPEKLYCNVLAKDITDHIKSKMGVSDVNS